MKTKTAYSAEETLSGAIERGMAALLSAQRADGHFVFEFEADATIPAEYILLTHYLGEAPDVVLEKKISTYLLRIQNKEGGWPLFHLGAFDMSASVKAYFALKMAGADIESEPMQRARRAILAHGGAEMSNVFTRFMLALFGILSWKAVPVMPVEIMLLPRWFPFHLTKISYWGRTVLVPMLVLQALKPRARNTLGVHIEELFIAAPQTIGPRSRAPHQKRSWFLLFAGIDKLLQWAQPFFLSDMRARATDKAVRFVKERLNGEDGLGAIFPAMANSVMMFDALGTAKHDPDYVIARKSLQNLLIVKEEEAYCQPCVSPVWDSALAAHALLEAGGAQAEASKALAWLKPRQVLELAGDWAAVRPHVRPGGWAFQYGNAYYPDLDDTAVVVMAMDRARTTGGDDFHTSIERAREWIEGMQSRNGGWASFDADNTAEYLNNIPFSDHGALLDPPTSDVTARCVSMLAQLGATSQNSTALGRGIDFLLREQVKDGSWFGRWGMNYIYGTWSACCALQAAGVSHDARPLVRAAEWLLAIQNEDGGWGEDGSSYRLDYKVYETFPSTPSQTAWALLALMAAGRVNDDAVARGVAYLMRTQLPEGGWQDVYHNAPGFPRIFYLRYHGYAQYFTLWALARYRNLRVDSAGKIYGM